MLSIRMHTFLLRARAKNERELRLILRLEHFTQIFSLKVPKQEIGHCGLFRHQGNIVRTLKKSCLHPKDFLLSRPASFLKLKVMLAYTQYAQAYHFFASLVKTINCSGLILDPLESICSFFFEISIFSDFIQV